MCRFLLYNSAEKKDINPLMNDFSQMCKDSKNFQGDGWGVIYKDGDELILHRSLNPIWEDDFELPNTEFALFHARFAHGASTKGDVENNQPFHKDGSLFVFNGLLRRVSLDIPGKIGAEKVLNFVLQEGVENAVSEMVEHSALVKSINFLLIQGQTCIANCYHSIDPEYFELRKYQSDEELLITSYDLPSWDFDRIKHGEVQEFELFQNITSLPIKT
jgi:hypothetical protein